MAGACLAKLIAEEKEDLIRRWRQRIAGTIDPAVAPSAELIDSLPAFLDELANYLQTRREETPDEATGRARALAAVHGTRRFHAGFSLGAVIREYGVLRDCVLDLIRDARVQVPKAVFSDVPDGTYFVRVSAIAADGLEGIPRVYAFERRANELAATATPGVHEYHFIWRASRTDGE